jgi:hypothetical protein
LATTAAATFEGAPVFSGLVLGLLPGFKLPWALLALPFALAAWTEPRRRAHRFRRFLTGYLAGWVLWAQVLPSATFGSDKALELSRDWIRLLRDQPPSLFNSDINQSLWATALRLGARPEVALGAAFVLAGWVLGRLILQTDSSSSGRIRRSGVLAWMAPWLLYMQWVNPLAWRWGSALAVGMPFAWEKTRLSRMARWTLACWLGFLWLLQQTPFLRLVGVQHWTDLHPYGVVSFYWLVLIGLAT